MNRPKTIMICPLLSGLLLSTSVMATELVYTPVNPSFGGSPLNGAWLLGNAQAQNSEKDPDAIDRSALTGTSALDRFTSMLESRLLNEMLPADLANANSGTLTTDDFIVEIINDAGNLSMVVTDRLTGEVSVISVTGLGAN